MARRRDVLRETNTRDDSFRTFEISRAAIDEEARTVDVSFSSEEPVQDFMFGSPRVLLHERKAVNLGPLKQMGAALINHDAAIIVGALQDIEIREDRKGAATIRFDKDDEAEKFFQKVQSGSLRGVSVRFSVQRAQQIGPDEEWESPEGQTFKGGERGLEVATLWTPREISLTPIPADVAVGVGRGVTRKEPPMFSEKTMARLKTAGLDAAGFRSEADAIKALDALDAARAAATPPEPPTPPVVPAPAPAAVPPVPAAVPPVPAADAAARQAEMAAAITQARAEDARKMGVLNELAGRLGEPAQAGIWFAAETSLEDVRTEVIKTLSERNPTPHFAPATERGLEARDKLRECASGGMLRGNGIAYKAPEGYKDADIPRFISMLDVARAVLTHHNVALPAFVQRDDLMRMALSHASGDFTAVLSNVASKSMQTGYTEATTTYQLWTKRGDNTDFKVASRPQIGEIQDFELVPDGMPLPEGTMRDKGSNVQLATYGRKFLIGRQAIMNDDQGAFTTMPFRFGNAGRRTINTAVYAHLASGASARGPTISEGSQSLQLFATTWASGGNLATGAALATGTIAAARTLMRLQSLLTAALEPGAVTPSTAKLNVSPRFLIVPATLENTADEIVNGIFFPTTAATSQTSLNRTLIPIADAQLDAFAVNDWYLAASPAEVETVEVTRLAGQDAPEFMEINTGDALGFGWAGFVDYDVQALEHRGLVKSEG